MDQHTYQNLSKLVGQRIVFMDGGSTIEGTLTEVYQNSDWVTVRDGAGREVFIAIDRLKLYRVVTVSSKHGAAVCNDGEFFSSATVAGNLARKYQRESDHGDIMEHRRWYVAEFSLTRETKA
jgi:hypothetical protein